MHSSMSSMADPIDTDLSGYNTLRLHSVAERMVVLRDVAQFHDEHEAWPRPLHILGGGSNLVPGERVGGTVVKVALAGRALLAEDADAWYVAAAAGENWHDFVQWTLAQGWPGLENLSLIPGTVGAAPIQNIGAYGIELKDRFHALTALSLEDGSVCVFTAEQCRFGYRDSVFKQEQAGRWLIIEVLFRLPKDWLPVLDYSELGREFAGQMPTPPEVASAVTRIRQCKLPDPAEIGNAGSFFHNPIVAAEQADALKARYPALPCYGQADGRTKLAAGWLIEQAGWKGRSLGPVGMYEKQALVLVNHGGATAHDVRALMLAVQHDVEERFGVPLQPEPVWW
jgi:UDP-N-acetylmuramate dehydrogenase